MVLFIYIKGENMNNSKIYTKIESIPTYGVGKNNKNPMFFEKRVYQASSGKVYPYPIIDTLLDKKVDKDYLSVYLENDYIKIQIIPEIGGKIHTAIDKTNGYDFVYRNEVIKPALVGLLGPWVSGGIEFNWPQHHRPTTFMKSECEILENEDGSVTAKLYDFDRMYGTSVVTSFTLLKDKSYIKIKARLYNPTCENQTFLWWANPAVAVNNNTQSIFPPDVTAVFDHGKRAVSKFPIATGEYYKHDYGIGVDISRYKNIPVPTSYMAYKSKYDFVGNYDYGKEAGLLHVASHHISPGKKQWTWGNGDFGQAWDRNLTDENGPYIELMTGVYADNQPDFTWLKPFEEKEFEQYFMPYKEVGPVKNANSDFILNLEKDQNKISVKVYSTGINDVVVSVVGNKSYLKEYCEISPIKIFEKEIKNESEGELLTLIVSDKNDRTLLSYTEEKEDLTPIPKPQNPAEMPEDLKTIEELYITGQHIEQYHHATFIPDDYYLEGLKRDPLDSRCNNAYGILCLRRGEFKKAERHFRNAIKRVTKLHPNPYDSEAFTNLGFSLWYQGLDSQAYDSFYKATWMQGEASIGYYMAALIDVKYTNYQRALYLLDRSLQYNTQNYNARALKVFTLNKLDKAEEALILVKQNLEDNPYDYNSLILYENMIGSQKLDTNRVNTYLNLASYFGSFNEASMALDILNRYHGKNIMVEYYKAYYLAMDKKPFDDQLQIAKNTPINSYFASSLEDQIVLMFAIKNSDDDYIARYLEGNICYANRRYDDAYNFWLDSKKINDKFSPVHRNLSLYLNNKVDDVEAAVWEIEKAFDLDKTDARTFYELDQMYKKINKSIDERLELYKKYFDLVEIRDDLKCEYATMLNIKGKFKEAHTFVMARQFSPWEGGEGKISTQYVISLRGLGKSELNKKNYKQAIEFLESALIFSHNLGEGKIEGDKSNDIYYYLGLAYKGLGDNEKAKESFIKATLGEKDPKGVLYYYDQSADMIYYQGLAHKELGNNLEMKKCFNKLIDYGEAHYFDHITLDYFAVSLPDLQLYDDDLDLVNKAHCSFLLALGYLGLGDSRYKKYLKETLELDNSHFRAALICD
jgi:tetratricopeptide (TPR) repeat protein